MTNGTALVECRAGSPTGLKGPVGYVLKMYPRFSETFIVNEVLAHEAAGLEIAIFSLRPPADGRFHATLAEVRAAVEYVPDGNVLATQFWVLVGEAAAEFPAIWDVLRASAAIDVRDIMQAVHVARGVRARGIVHLHAHFATVAATVARLAAELSGVTYSFTAHAKDIFHESVDPVELCTLLDRASRVVTVSEFNVAFLRESYGPASRNVRLVYNGLDLERFPYSADGSREPVIVSVGRLIEKKGFEDLIDACDLLRRAGTGFHCRIIGTGPLEAALRARIEALGLGDWVTLAGAKPQHEVIEIVQAAAVFAAPCVVGADGNRDGLPTVLLEAMALGTPCIGTPVTGIPEVVRHDETGLLVPEHDPAALAEALRRILGEPALGRRLAAHARGLIEQRFDIERNTAVQREHFVASVAEGVTR